MECVDVTWTPGKYASSSEMITSLISSWFRITRYNRQIWRKKLLNSFVLLHCVISLPSETIAKNDVSVRVTGIPNRWAQYCATSTSMIVTALFIKNSDFYVWKINQNFIRWWIGVFVGIASTVYLATLSVLFQHSGQILWTKTRSFVHLSQFELVLKLLIP